MGFFRPLKAAVEGSGAEVLYEAVATSLITDENGRVIGVCADYDGGSKNVKANKAVILAGGGFTSNEEKVRDHLPYKANPGWPVTNPNEDGSCIQMAQKIGADLKGMSETQIGFSVYTTTTVPAKASWSMKTGCALPPKTSTVPSLASASSSEASTPTSSLAII